MRGEMFLDKIRILQMGASNIGRGGRSTIAYQIYKNLDRKRFVSDFLCMGELPSEQYCKEVEKTGGRMIHYSDDLGSGGYFYNIKRIIFFLKEVRMGKFDIAHIHTDNASEFFPRALLCKVCGIKTIIAHGHTSKNDTTIQKMKNKICQWFMPLLCEYILGCSYPAIEYLYSGKNIRKALIPNGIDCDKYQFNKNIRNKVRSQQGWSDKTFVVGHVGRFDTPKNHPFIIEIFDELQKINREAKLLLIGNGEAEEKIKSLVEKKGIANKVIFWGLSDHVEELLWAMDVFLLPSLYEGFPLVAIEAETAGLPTYLSSTISENVVITPYTVRYSLEMSAVEWASNINKCYKHGQSEENRLNAWKCIEKSEHHIKRTSQKVEKIYKTLRAENKLT